MKDNVEVNFTEDYIMEEEDMDDIQEHKKPMKMWKIFKE